MSSRDSLNEASAPRYTSKDLPIITNGVYRRRNNNTFQLHQSGEMLAQPSIPVPNPPRPCRAVMCPLQDGKARSCGSNCQTN